MKKLFFLIVLLLIFSRLKAQDEGEETNLYFGQPDSTFSLIRESPITINLDEEEEEEDEEKKEKKPKKKVFYGVKTKKGFTRRGYGNNVTLELFYYLKQAPTEVDPYVPEIFWYDVTQKKIRSAREFDPRKGYILHGPYKVLVGNNLVEDGIFYYGMKHGRWTNYDKEGILLNKEKYYKGWPKESKVKYYANDQTKLKEIIPLVYGEKQGDYYYFHENGMIALKGEYKEGEKVGRWTEFYPFLNRRKKEIVYPSSPYDKTTKPYISREWNRRGQVVYQRD